MRYSNWDVLLFPAATGDAKVPLQEFRTVCEVVQDPSADHVPSSSHPAYFSTVTRPVPTVSCFVPSLPQGCAFRVSVHSWTPPTASPAATSMAPHEGLIAFEAKVLVDGVCVAGAVFNKNHTWPQVIDDKGRADQLRFPPFHTEMLTQAWVVPAQTLGRIKVIIAEGMHSGLSSQFEKIRNIVAFSFQHAPLPVLEDTNIAWPNQSIWYQSAQQFHNPLSPRKMKEADPDSHAHSPRRESPKKDGARSNVDRPIAPPRMPKSFANPPAFRQSAISRMPFSAYSQDPFIGSSEATNWESWKHATRNSSGSGDISMPDHFTASSSGRDQSMTDYSRPISPSSFRSNPMPDYPRPTSAASKPTSDWERSLYGTVRADMVASEKGEGATEVAASEHDHNSEEHVSQFTEMMAALSPSRTSNSGTHAPANTRVSSANNTPPAAPRPSAAAEARASSYSGKVRTVSITTRDPPPPIVPLNVDSAPKSRSSSRNSESHHADGHDDGTPKASSTIKKKPTGSVKSRKEGRSSDVGLDVPLHSRAPRRLSGQSSYHNDKENVEARDTSSPFGSDNKRRKTSDNIDGGASLEVCLTSGQIHSPKDDKATMDPLMLVVDGENPTDEQRVPLRNLENSI